MKRPSEQEEIRMEKEEEKGEKFTNWTRRDSCMYTSEMNWNWIDPLNVPMNQEKRRRRRDTHSFYTWAVPNDGDVVNDAVTVGIWSLLID